MNRHLPIYILLCATLPLRALASSHSPSGADDSNVLLQSKAAVSTVMTEADVANGPKYIERARVADEGNGVGDFFGATLEKCKAECTKNAKCNSFTFAHGANCHLKDKVVTASDPNNAHGANFKTYYKESFSFFCDKLPHGESAIKYHGSCEAAKAKMKQLGVSMICNVNRWGTQLVFAHDGIISGTTKKEIQSLNNKLKQTLGYVYTFSRFASYLTSMVCNEAVVVLNR